MAFFKFRWPGQKRQDGKSTKPSRAQRTESVDVMRRRARHRLIGAAVLVSLGVIGFPMLFDTQPRPIPVDIPIEIPDRNRAGPLLDPDGTPLDAAEAPASRAATVASLSVGEEVIDAPSVRKPVPAPDLKPEPKPEPEPKPVPKPEPKPEPKPVPKPEPKPLPKPEPPKPPQPSPSDEAARARALLEGRAPPPPAPAPVVASAAQEGRFIVQVGAFAEVEKAREARQKVERAGLKTYTQVVETKDGKRIRVRVGPLANRAEAEKAAARIRAIDLPASILTL